MPSLEGEMGTLNTALRSGLLVAAGAALMVAPLPLGLGFAAAVTGLVVGTLAIALGLTGTAPDGRGTLPLSAQAVYDRGLALGLMIAAVAFGLADQDAALTFFGGAGLTVLAVATSTRYTARPIEKLPLT